MAVELDRWDRFILRHRKGSNLVFHFVSMLLYFGTPVVALVTWNPWWLAGFLCSGLVGTAGHFIFQDGAVSLREATVAREVPYYVPIIFYKIARGTYRADVERAAAKAGMART